MAAAADTNGLAPSPQAPARNPAPTPPSENATSALPTLSKPELQVALAMVGDGPATSPVALAASLGMDPTDFLNILARPHVQQWIEAADAAERDRAERLAQRAKAEALELLRELARDKAADPVERRRAASAILRALRPPARRSAPDAPARPPSRPPGDEPNDREALRAQWKADARALCRRYDFSSSDAAAASLARIFTDADPGDPDAALSSLFLVTYSTRNFQDPDKFLRCTRDLRPAAGASLVSLDHVEKIGAYECYRMVLEPRDRARPPLDLTVWLEFERPDRHWKVLHIRPWNNGQGLDAKPWYPDVRFGPADDPAEPP